MILTGRDIQKKAVLEVGDLLVMHGFTTYTNDNGIVTAEAPLAEIIAQAWNLYGKYVGVLGLIEFEERE